MTIFPPKPPTTSNWAARDEALRENIPIIVCTSGPDAPYSHQPEFGTLKFNCPHCLQTHHHGAAEGFRNARCLDAASPYYAHGYYLVHENYA